jgi:hypothetical protein
MAFVTISNSMNDHTSNARRRILRKLLLASAAALAVMPAISADAVDQPVIKSMTFAPQPVVAGAPAGTPIGTVDVVTSGATALPEVKSYSNRDLCNLRKSNPPAIVELGEVGPCR